MRWLKNHLRDIGIASVILLFFLSCLTLFPLSVTSAHKGTSGVATLTIVTVQATPTVDATVTALNKEQLILQVKQLQNQNTWFANNSGALIAAFSALVVAIFGLYQWRGNRNDERKKEKDAQDKELKDREAERVRRETEQQRWLIDQAEKRFQAAVEGLSSEREGARIGAAILLRTFLRPGYEQFYTQTFDLAVAHLRLPRTARLLEEDPDALHTPPQADPNRPLPLTTLSQALITVFKESFPLAHDRLKEANPHFNPQSLDAGYTQLDKANLNYADLKQAWMPEASLQEANLFKANLIGANLTFANLSKANLIEAKLSSNETSLNGATLREATLNKADLSHAYLINTNFSHAYLMEADLTGVSLLGAKLEETDLKGAKLRGAALLHANFSHADLLNVDFSGSSLNHANLSGANLSYANFSEVFLADADLRGADLSHAKHLDTATSMENTDLRGVKGLTNEQKAAYQAKGAIIDEDSTTSSSQPIIALPSLLQSNGTQASSAPPTQESTPASNPGQSGAAPFQQGSES